MKRSELQNLRKYAGDLSGIYGMQDITYNEGRAKGMRAIPVSYTHLHRKGSKANNIQDECLFSSVPVSYTHLDVYKRQMKGCSTKALPPSWESVFHLSGRHF